MAKGLQILEVDEELAEDYVESVEHPADKGREYRDRIRQKWEQAIRDFCR